ncbi:MAG TPA: phage tail tube protein [Candidatus Binatia bacterium]|nr:phage tail tube protein [Candidatus Binatia bacterium]
MGEANRVAVRISAETNWGETPSSPTMQALLRTGGGMETMTDTVVSNSVRSDRMRHQFYRTGIRAEGGYDFELAYGQYDTLLSHALCAAYASAVAISATTISAATSDDSFNDSGSGFVSGGVQAGMWILVAGFANAGNNGLFKVGTVAAGKIVPSARIDLTTTLYSTTVNLTTEAAGPTVTIRNQGMLRNGTTAQSLLIEEYHEDTTDDSFNDSANGFVAAGIQAGMVILIGGFANAGNNGLFKVGTVAAGKIVPSARIDLTTGLYSTTVQLVDEAATPTITIRNQGMLRNGTTALSLLIEEAHEDTTDFYTYRGCRVNTLDMEIAANSLATGRFGVTGKSGHRAGSTASGSVTAVNSNLAFNTSENIWGFNEGDGSFTESIQSLSLAVNNNLRYNNAVGSLYPSAIAYGTQDLTGSIQIYNSTGADAIIDKYLAFTETEFSFVISNGSSALYYVITLPRIKFSKGTPMAGGLDEDTMVPLDWVAYGGGGTYQIQIDRITAA